MYTYTLYFRSAVDHTNTAYQSNVQLPEKHKSPKHVRNTSIVLTDNAHTVVGAPHMYSLAQERGCSTRSSRPTTAPQDNS